MINSQTLNLKFLKKAMMSKKKIFCLLQKISLLVKFKNLI